MKHTPTPLKSVQPTEREWWVVDSEGFWLAKTTNREMADRIVHTVNSHERLVELGEKTLQFFDKHFSNNRVHPLRNEWKAALAAAKGES